jgi:hypothetical protein
MGDSPDLSTAARKERSNDSAAASARPSPPGKRLRNTSTGGCPRDWCTPTMQWAYAAVPGTTPCVAQASANARSNMPSSLTMVPIKPQHASEMGIPPLT